MYVCVCMLVHDDVCLCVHTCEDIQYMEVMYVCMCVLYICVCVCVFEPLTVGRRHSSEVGFEVPNTFQCLKKLLALFVFGVFENKLISKRTSSHGFHSYIVVTEWMIY